MSTRSPVEIVATSALSSILAALDLRFRPRSRIATKPTVPRASTTAAAMKMEILTRAVSDSALLCLEGRQLVKASRSAAAVVLNRRARKIVPALVPDGTTNIPATGVIGLDLIGLADPAIRDLAFLGMPTRQVRTTYGDADGRAAGRDEHGRFDGRFRH